MRIKAIGRNPAFKRATDIVMRFIPIAALVGLASFISAQQAISPHRRVIKFAVLLGLLAMMLRFDLVYSVYLFTVLFPFPSSVSIGSTNSILMTLIPLIWAVRATSTKTAIIVRRTRVDGAIIVFLFAYVISFFNVESTSELKQSLTVVWRTFGTIVYFYLIVTFVDDEKKIFTLLKITCAVCGLIMLTAVFELLLPGRALIPGWIGYLERGGIGEIGYRIEGMRVGGALKSQAMLADFGTRTFFLLIFLTMRTKNAFEKLIWGGVTLLTIVAVVATANRGAFFSLALGAVYLLFLFRKRISMVRMVVLIGTVTAIFAVSEVLLTKYTFATSLSQRILGTQFEGFVPDTRGNTWENAVRGSMDHPFIGHGPYYDIGEGLTYQLWPHNGYIFYLYTIGIIGLLAFFAILYKIWKYSLCYRLPHVNGTRLADLGKVLHAVFFVTLFQQLRTDFQRDDVYPYMVWLIFGFITTVGLVLEARSRELAKEPPEAAGGGENGRRRPFRRWRRGRLRS
jgi:O-antigen ligase